MTEQEKYLRDEIAWLLGGLTFTAGHGRFLGGRLTMVEFCVTAPKGFATSLR